MALGFYMRFCENCGHACQDCAADETRMTKQERDEAQGSTRMFGLLAFMGISLLAGMIMGAILMDLWHKFQPVSQ